jgi:hypothetical protein
MTTEQREEKSLEWKELVYGGCVGWINNMYCNYS